MQKIKNSSIFAKETTQHMADIIATNGRETRKFSEIQWKLLGKDKNGWEALADQEISNVVKSVAKPSPGSKKAIEVPIENLVGKNKDEQKVGNIVKPDAGSKSDDSKKIESTPQEKKDKWLEATKGITAGTIKDYFDTQKTEYKKNAKTIDLVDQLGQHLGYDVDKFNLAFN